MKRALIVTTVSGFVPQFEMNNVKILQKLGYEVHYASNFYNVSYGSDNHRLDGTGIIRHQIDFSRSPYRLKENIKAYKQLKCLMQKQHFDLIHCHTPVGAALTRLVVKNTRRLKKDESNKKAYVIYTAHGFHFYKGAPLRYWLLFYPVERWLANYTDIIITINEEDYNRAKLFCRHKATKVEHIFGVGIDTAYFSGNQLQPGEREHIRSSMREKLHMKDNEVMLLSVGELIPRKNHEAVLKALHEIDLDNLEITRPYHYFICGQGDLLEELCHQIASLNLSDKVSLMGYQQDIRQLLFAADVFVFPSKQEGLSMALMEAIAAGVPLIVSDIRGNRELVGCTESYSNTDQLVQKIKMLLTDTKQLGNKPSNVSADKFDLRQIEKHMHKIYEEFEE